jgi:hypothetical protein
LVSTHVPSLVAAQLSAALQIERHDAHLPNSLVGCLAGAIQIHPGWCASGLAVPGCRCGWRSVVVPRSLVHPSQQLCAMLPHHSVCVIACCSCRRRGEPSGPGLCKVRTNSLFSSDPLLQATLCLCCGWCSRAGSQQQAAAACKAAADHGALPHGNWPTLLLLTQLNTRRAPAL